MKAERIIIAVLALALMLTLGVQLGQAQILGPGAPHGQAANAPAAALDDKIMIQGRLTDAGGKPLTGSYSITASIYDVSSGAGAARCAETATVTVSNGLFSMGLDGCDDSDINGDQLYLGIKVGSDAEMTPRQGIYAVPYARSLRPGAVISGTVAGDATIHAVNSATDGRALRGYATGTTGTNYGVIGRSSSANGYGGFFGNSGGGSALYAEGDVAQDRTADGFVKAAVYLYCGDSSTGINRYFNNVNGVAITATNGGSEGRCTVDLNFTVNDRFFVVSPVASYPFDRGAACDFTDPADQLVCWRYDTSDGTGTNGFIMILIY